MSMISLHYAHNVTRLQPTLRFGHSRDDNGSVGDADDTIIDAEIVDDNSTTSGDQESSTSLVRIDFNNLERQSSHGDLVELSQHRSGWLEKHNPVTGVRNNKGIIFKSLAGVTSLLMFLGFVSRTEESDPRAEIIESYAPVSDVIEQQLESYPALTGFDYSPASFSINQTLASATLNDVDTISFLSLMGALSMEESMNNAHVFQQSNPDLGRVIADDPTGNFALAIDYDGLALKFNDLLSRSDNNRDAVEAFYLGDNPSFDQRQQVDNFVRNYSFLELFLRSGLINSPSELAALNVGDEQSQLVGEATDATPYSLFNVEYLQQILGEPTGCSVSNNRTGTQELLTEPTGWKGSFLEAIQNPEITHSDLALLGAMWTEGCGQLNVPDANSDVASGVTITDKNSVDAEGVWHYLNALSMQSSEPNMLTNRNVLANYALDAGIARNDEQALEYADKVIERYEFILLIDYPDIEFENQARLLIDLYRSNLDNG